MKNLQKLYWITRKRLERETKNALIRFQKPFPSDTFRTIIKHQLWHLGHMESELKAEREKQRKNWMKFYSII